MGLNNGNTFFGKACSVNGFIKLFYMSTSVLIVLVTLKCSPGTIDFGHVHIKIERQSVEVGL